MKTLQLFLASLIIGAALLLLPQNVSAHVLDFAVIKTSFDVKDNVISFHTEFPLYIDFGGESDEAIQNFYTTYHNEQFFVKHKEFKCNIAIQNVERYEQEQKTIIDGSYTCADRINSLKELSITNTAYSDLFKEYNHFVNVTIKGKKTELLFKNGQTSYPPEKKNEKKETSEKEKQPDNFWSIIKQFTHIGIEHIVLGYDHLLFLFSIILLFSTFRRVLFLVTSFTIAHSITLIAASSGLVMVSPKLVEPMIALSIAFMAIRNIWILKMRKEVEVKERWMVVFGFGLIHGLGFAGALGEIGIPKEHFFSSLLSFNLGVELGQLMILAVVMPYLILLKPQKFRKPLLYIISAIIALIAIFWFFERILA